MNIQAKLEKREKKDGTGVYWCIIIPITKDYNKIVFVNGLELSNLKLAYNIKED